MTYARRIAGQFENCLGAVALAVALVGGGLPAGAFAQDSLAAIAATAADSPAYSREQEYAAIAAEVAALERQGNLLKRVVRLVTPTVVHIEARRDDNENEKIRGTIDEAGAGIMVESGERFYVVTNRHVIKHSQTEHIKIQLADGRVLTPTQIAADRETDLAVLAVHAPGLVPARIGDSNKLEIGDFVFAVGSPFGLSHSVTYGIISAKGRRDLQLGDDGVRFQDFLQTDASINPGNSGGPLLNLRGEVVGINTAIASSSGGSEGIGFTIPINMVMTIAQQLIDTGKVVRAYLGVKLDASFTPLAAEKIGLVRPVGARVTGITASSPAEAARLQIGDVILQFDGIDIEDDNHLINLVSLTPVNKEVDVIVYRQGKQVPVRVKVGDRNEIE
jgi:serine protease Do